MSGAEASVPTRILPVHPQFAPAGAALPLTMSLTVATLVAFALSAAALTAPFPPGPASLMTLHLLTTGVLVPVALSASMQLTGALFAPGPHPGRIAWLLPLAWAGGVMIPLGMDPLPAVLAPGGALLTVSTVGVAAFVAPRLVRGDAASAPLRLGVGVSLGGILATELAGLRMAVSGPGARALGLHVALAATSTLLPLLVAVSGQLFPMFAHAPPSPPAQWLRRVALTSLGALGTVLAAATGWGPLLPASLAVLGWGLALWVLEQERDYARRHSRQRDPAVVGARLHALALVVAAALGLGGALFAAPSALASAVTLAIVGGLAGSVLSYLRRILPFVLWQSLFRRHGPRIALPKLDELRPRFPVAVLPSLWLAGAVILSALPFTGPAPALTGGRPLLVLAAAALLGAFELLVGPVRAWRFDRAHRRR